MSKITNTTATINLDGTFKVHGIDYVFVGEYDNYREMDYEAGAMLRVHPKGYVCHVETNKPNEYVLILPKGSEYLIVNE